MWLRPTTSGCWPTATCMQATLMLPCARPSTYASEPPCATVTLLATPPPPPPRTKLPCSLYPTTLPIICPLLSLLGEPSLVLPGTLFHPNLPAASPFALTLPFALDYRKVPPPWQPPFLSPLPLPSPSLPRCNPSLSPHPPFPFVLPFLLFLTLPLSLLL